jgi:hypothetical protein
MTAIIESRYQLICEGKADEVFFARLLRRIGKNVQVSCPRKEIEGLGKAAIRHRLVGLQSEFDNIDRLVLAVDSDDDPTQAFADGCTEFAQANAANPAKQYPIPPAANTIAALAGSPATAIVLVPAVGTRGCLDTLLLPSFEQQYAGVSVNCVDDFCTCIRDARRGETRDSKVRLRALIAASQARNPGISLSLLLEEKNCPVDLGHASFDPIRGVLTNLFP